MAKAPVEPAAKAPVKTAAPTPVKTAPAGKAAPAPAAKAAPVKTAPAPAAEAPAQVPASRGPRGVLETAVITLVATENPKRAGSKAHAKFALYESGMTVAEFIDAVDANPEIKGGATSTLVYDAAHGYITIEGYDPAKKFEPKPKKEKAAKTPKAKKGAAAASEETETTGADAEADEEQVD